MELLKAKYCLLYWYHEERNWSVQTTSAIKWPLRDPESYQKGMLVMARFQGKLYRAAIIRVKGMMISGITLYFLLNLQFILRLPILWLKNIASLVHDQFPGAFLLHRLAIFSYLRYARAGHFGTCKKNVISAPGLYE